MEHHYTEIHFRILNLTRREREYYVTCSCGYWSRVFLTRRDAEHDEGEHVRLMTNE